MRLDHERLRRCLLWCLICGLKRLRFPQVDERRRRLAGTAFNRLCPVDVVLRFRLGRERRVRRRRRRLFDLEAAIAFFFWDHLVQRRELTAKEQVRLVDLL